MALGELVARNVLRIQADHLAQDPLLWARDDTTPCLVDILHAQLVVRRLRGLRVVDHTR